MSANPRWAVPALEIPVRAQIKTWYHVAAL